MRGKAFVISPYENFAEIVRLGMPEEQLVKAVFHGLDFPADAAIERVVAHSKVVLVLVVSSLEWDDVPDNDQLPWGKTPPPKQPGQCKVHERLWLYSGEYNDRMHAKGMDAMRNAGYVCGWRQEKAWLDAFSKIEFQERLIDGSRAMANAITNAIWAKVRRSYENESAVEATDSDQPLIVEPR
jgi:hypothetical protein